LVIFRGKKEITNPQPKKVRGEGLKKKREKSEKKAGLIRQKSNGQDQGIPPSLG